jgi:hypothetical protein
MSEDSHRFVQNDADLSVLPHLTDQDLKELGVSPGHWREMLATVAELGTVAELNITIARAEAPGNRRAPPCDGDPALNSTAVAQPLCLYGKAEKCGYRHI